MAARFTFVASRGSGVPRFGPEKAKTHPRGAEKVGTLVKKRPVALILRRSEQWAYSSDPSMAAVFEFRRCGLGRDAPGCGFGKGRALGRLLAGRMRANRPVPYEALRRMTVYWVGRDCVRSQ